MFQILKLHLQGLSAYRIARKLNLDPPMVYASLKAAKTNFGEAENMLTQLSPRLASQAPRRRKANPRESPPEKNSASTKSNSV
jgi:hypothetical protein